MIRNGGGAFPKAAPLVTVEQAFQALSRNSIDANVHYGVLSVGFHFRIAKGLKSGYAVSNRLVF
mgnify:CR=1 FL=1